MPLPRPRSAFAALAFAASLLVSSRSTAGTPVRVVTSIPPLAMIVSLVGGDRVVAHSILPPGADPHTFEPRPSDARAVAAADVVVLLGSEIDDWLEKALADSPHAVVVRLDPDAGGHEPGHSHHHGEGEEAGHGDEGQHDLHVWLDPRWVRDRALPAVHRALGDADPDGRPRYGVAARAAGEKLTDLEDDVREALGGAATRNFFSWHPAWGAFAERFGLHPVASLRESEGLEPSLFAMASSLRAARAAGVRAVLVEPQADRRAAEVFAAELGLATLTVDPLGDAWSVDRATYDSLIRFNARVFARALGVETDDEKEDEGGK